MSQPQPSLIGMNLDDLTALTAECGLPRFQAKQIARLLYAKRIASIDAMTYLPKAARELMAARYRIGREAPIERVASADGTVKYLFDAGDGCAVESVFIPEADRATLCISSQKGCKMGCAFCMTGRQGFHGNLTTAQIINQVLSIPESEQLTNVVFMGMGEPTDNLEAVISAIGILTADWGLAWSPKRVTVSSIGRIAELRAIIERTDVHIAISVHSPFHEERLELMPVERAYRIADVIDAMRDYDFAHQRRLSVEYIVWDRLNDDYRHADALAQLLRGTAARVNLIRFHRIPASPLKPAPMATMEAFRDRLNAAGVLCTIRRSRGEDIQAACGMLAGKH